MTANTRKSNTRKSNTRTPAEKRADVPAKVSKKIQRANEKAAALKSLRPLARVINAKLSSVAKLEGKVDDTRLAACVAISEAYEIATAGHVRFKEWCESTVHALGYESLRKMRPIGDAERAEEGAGLKMLREMRERNAGANRKARASKASEPSEDGDDSGEPSEPSESASVPRPQDPIATMRAIFATLNPDQQVEFTMWCEDQIDGTREAANA